MPSGRVGSLACWSVACLLLAILSGCGDDRSTGPADEHLQITGVTAAPGNVLTARVALEVGGLDSVRMEYETPGEPLRVTPARRMEGDSLSIRVAGMRADTLYSLRAVGWRGGQEVASDTTSFRTPALPEALAQVSWSITQGTPTSGYFLMPLTLGPDGYVVLFDSVGVVRWYFNTSAIYPSATQGDFQQLPNGNIVLYAGGTRGWDAVFGLFYEVNLDGQVVRTYGAQPPLYTDNHELLLDFVDSVPVASTLFTYDIRVTDLTMFGGGSAIPVAGHQLVRQLSNGSNRFFWNAWDHFSLLDWIEEPASFRTGPSADFDHPNSLDLDLDGNYIVSWRSMGEITKIDARSGAVIWRWGGRNNQFTFVNDALGLFSGQHCVKVLPNGHFIVYDNGWRHTPSESRIAEYQLDPVAHTATLVWEYRHTPAIFTSFLGWVQRLQNGNTFIGWGGNGVMQEVTPDKQSVWEAVVLYQGVAATFYRARRVPDLYAFQTP